MCEAGSALGLSVRVFAESADDSAAQIASDVELGAADSFEDLERFATGCDVVTGGHELVDLKQLERLASAGHSLRPSPAVIALTLNRRRQRRELKALGLPIPAYRTIDELSELLEFAEQHGWPLVAKAVRGGHDGRGVWVVESPVDAETLLGETKATGVELLVERFVEIERELAVQVARRPNGEVVAYPVVETVQIDGICREVVAPAELSPELTAAARAIGLTIAERCDVVGTLTVELFESDGELLINELVAGPHVAGHYSIEGCLTSQFENHLRAVLDWPLGSAALVAPAVATANVIGSVAPPPTDARERALAVPGAHVHLYGKSYRQGRKLGHVTALGGSRDEALEKVRVAAGILSGELAMENQ